MFSIVPALIVLGFLVIVHELGHFIACRIHRIKVEKFSIGFGPEIFHWQGKETRYAVSLFPLGGFVKPAGETVGDVGEGGAKPGDYLAATVPARIMVVISGVVMNYLFAFILFTALFMIGRPVAGTVIGGFVDGYPAKASGLAVGDKVVEIDREAIRTWKELTDALERSSGGEASFRVLRGDRELTFAVTPKTEEGRDVFGQTVKVKRIGIIPNPEAVSFESYGLWSALQAAWTTEIELAGLTHKAIFYLVMGKLSIKNISGPVGIINMTGAAAKLGLPYVIQLMAILSVSLAVINLLPIPALDGGHLIFLLVEGVIRKPVSLRVQEWLTQAGFILLLAFMAFILYNDLVNIQVIEKLKHFFIQ
jgi:regulator of sigma E protease